MPSTLLPAETGVGPVTLIVANLEEERRFYQDILGMALVSAGEDVVSLGATRPGGDGLTPLVTLVERRDAPSRPRTAPGLYHMALLMPSREALAHVLLRLSATRYHLQGAADHLVSEALYLADPQGNGIEIYADTPRERWEREGTGIRMGTAPLDMRGLLAEADSGPREWQGLPAGSRMGHIHLKVRELEETARFYQETLGFSLTARYGDQALFFSAGGYHHHLGANTWESRGARPAPDGALGLSHYTIVVPAPQDQRAVEDRAGRVGEAVAWDPEGLWLRDPSGNRLCIMEAAALERAPGDAADSLREDAAGI